MPKITETITRHGRGYLVRVDGRELHLTPTEFRLLEVLRGEPGRAFTRTELVSRVMPDSIVLERTIDVHVRSLREKLGTAAVQIETVPQVGYRYLQE